MLIFKSLIYIKSFFESYANIANQAIIISLIITIMHSNTCKRLKAG